MSSSTRKESAICSTTSSGSSPLALIHHSSTAADMIGICGMYVLDGHKVEGQPCQSFSKAPDCGKLFRAVNSFQRNVDIGQLGEVTIIDERPPEVDPGRVVRACDCRHNSITVPPGCKQPGRKFVSPADPSAAHVGADCLRLRLCIVVPHGSTIPFRRAGEKPSQATSPPRARSG